MSWTRNRNLLHNFGRQILLRLILLSHNLTSFIHIIFNFIETFIRSSLFDYFESKEITSDILLDQQGHENTIESRLKQLLSMKYSCFYLENSQWTEPISTSLLSQIPSHFIRLFWLPVSYNTCFRNLISDWLEWQRTIYVTDPDLVKMFCLREDYRCEFIDYRLARNMSRRKLARIASMTTFHIVFFLDLTKIFMNLIGTKLCFWSIITIFRIVSGWEWIYSEQTNPPSLIQMDGETEGNKVSFKIVPFQDHWRNCRHRYFGSMDSGS